MAHYSKLLSHDPTDGDKRAIDRRVWSYRLVGLPNDRSLRRIK
jgi:hypothetical protein